MAKRAWRAVRPDFGNTAWEKVPDMQEEKICRRCGAGQSVSREWRCQGDRESGMPQAARGTGGAREGLGGARQAMPFCKLAVASRAVAWYNQLNNDNRCLPSVKCNRCNHCYRSCRIPPFANFMDNGLNSAKAQGGIRREGGTALLFYGEKEQARQGAWKRKGNIDKKHFAGRFPDMRGKLAHFNTKPS